MAGTAPSMTVERMLNQCLRKTVFRRFTDAQKRADKWNVLEPPEPGKIFQAYYCALCGHFHVGRTRKETNNGIRHNS